MYTQYSIHSHVSTMLAKVETIFFGYHGKCQGQQKSGGGAGLKDTVIFFQNGFDFAKHRLKGVEIWRVGR